MRVVYPPTEKLRLERLNQLNLFSGEQEQEYEDIARMACELFDTPIAAISLMDTNRQCFKASIGLDITETSRDGSFCTYAIYRPEDQLIVPDATRDHRFSQSTLVTGELGIRFYASSPLITSDGIPLGTLFVMDRIARQPTSKQLELLAMLARQVIALIESRGRQARLEDAIRKVRQSEEILRAAGQIGKLGYWRVELPTQKLEWSDMTRIIHEVDSDYVPNVETAINFYAPESRPRILQAVNDAIQLGRPYDLELQFITAKDRRLTVRTIGTPEYRDDKVVAISGVFQDISSSKHAEIQAIQANQCLSKVSAMVPGFLYQFMLRPDGTSCFPYASDGIRSIYRVTPEQVRQDASDVFKILHPDDYNRIVESIDESARTLNTWQCEYRVKFSDGTSEWLEGKASPERLSDGSILWHGFITNISARIKSEHRIRENEQRLTVALDASNTGLWDWSPVENTTYFSDRWYTMLGYEPGEMPMHVDSWRKILHPEDEKSVMEKLQRHIDGTDPVYRAEQRVRQKDGTYRWIHDIGVIVERLKTGEPSRMIGVHIDIDLQKRAQADLERARADAEIANRTKSEFLANMSHEIRTPLTAILGFSDMLRETQSPDQQKYVADIIQRNGEHLLSILNDILDLSKIEAQKLKIEILPVEIRTLLNDTISLISNKAGEKNIMLVCECDPQVPAMIKSDPTRLRQILLNLLSNSVKFTNQGSVTLRLKHLMTQRNKVNVRIEVEDTGIGMSHDQLNRIFKPFEQADQSTTRQFGGTGLGLTITQRLTQMLGGEIRVVSKSGHGTTFYITFEFDVAETEKTGDSDTKTSGNAKLHADTKILVVDDAPDNIRLLQFVLKKIGINPATATNGQEAIDVREQLLKSGRDFDQIILDMQMPVKDGFTTASELRELGYEGRIIALTANAMSEVRMKCLSAGCDDFLTKPINARSLYNAINVDSKRAAA